MTDDQFVEAFESQTLPADRFRHADHVRLAWIYLRRMTLPAAMARYSDRLKAFATHLGQGGLYHETITYAFLMIINDRIADSAPEESFAAFKARNPDLFEGVAPVLGRYYRPETLASDRSRAGFVMPDRLTG